MHNKGGAVSSPQPNSTAFSFAATIRNRQPRYEWGRSFSSDIS
jgi:hypothetical protein